METIFVTVLPVVKAAVTSPDANNHFLLDTIVRLKWQTCFKPQQQMTKHEHFKAWLLLQGHQWDLGMRVWNHPGLRSCTLCLVRLTLATEWTHYQTINTPLAHFRLNECRQNSSCLHWICLNAILHVYQWAASGVSSRSCSPQEDGSSLIAMLCHVYQGMLFAPIGCDNWV